MAQVGWLERATAMRRSRRRPLLTGVVSAILLFVGLASMAAITRPPFLLTDESAHIGYAHAVAGGDLPEVTTTADPPATAEQWRAELASALDDRYRTIWVANHPPLHYVVATPLIWLSDAVGSADGGLLALRLFNIACAAIGVGLTYFLARDLSGGVGRIGFTAACIAALVPHGHGLFSLALTDGSAFAASTFVTWVGVRCLQRGLSTRNIVMLAGATAAAAGVRLAALAVAVVVLGFVAVFQLVDRRQPPDRRLRSAALVAGACLSPAVLLWGWFYVRNIDLYGDVAGSSFLLERFDRQPRGSLWELLTWGHLWADISHALLFRNPPIERVEEPPGADLLAVLAVIGLAVAAVTGRSAAGAAPDGGGRRVARASLALAVLVVVLVVVMTAEHLSGGGSRYARYLLPALGVAASLVAVGLDRLWPRILPAIAIVLLGIHSLWQVSLGGDPSTLRRPRDGGAAMPGVLQVIPSSPLARSVALAIIVVGGVGVIDAMMSAIARVRRRRAHGATDLNSASFPA